MSLSLLAALASSGCTSSSQPSGVDAATSNVTSSNPCAKKACGVDCTPEGSDEPQNCNSAGQCAAPGEPLNCQTATCPDFLADCIQGQLPADLDDDGCFDACAPFVTGRVLFPTGWAPSGASAAGVVEVHDVTLADSPSVKVGSVKISVTGDAPFAFRVPVKNSEETRSYTVQAHIDTDGDGTVTKGDLLTTESFPVLTFGYPSTVDVTVHPIP